MLLYELIGQRVKELRHSLAMTQKRLAEESDVARASIANLEAGRQFLPLPQLFKIAQALDVDYRDLLPEPTRLVSPSAQRVTEESVYEKAPVTAALIHRLQSDDDSS